MFCLPMPHDKFETETPWVLIAIVVIDAVLLAPVMGRGGGGFIEAHGFIPSNATFLSFFSAMFLHTGIWPYAGNMLFLWIFGRKIESTLGHLAFALSFLLAGVGGQVLYWITAAHSHVPCVGASGAIAGVAGIYLILYPKDRFDLHLYFGWWRVKTIESTTRIAVGVWIGEQALLAVLTIFLPVFRVAFWAHVGGFAAGMGVAWFYAVRTPVGSRPSFLVVEVPLAAEIEQPNPLTGLNLSMPSKRLVSQERETNAVPE